MSSRHAVVIVGSVATTGSPAGSGGASATCFKGNGVNHPRAPIALLEWENVAVKPVGADLWDRKLTDGM